jgi:hypothetical protein
VDRAAVSELNSGSDAPGDRAAMNGHFRHAHSYVLQHIMPRIRRTTFRNRSEQWWSALALHSTQDQLLISEVQVFSICFTTDSGIGM